MPNLAVRVVSYARDKAGPIGNDVIVEGPAIRVLREVIGILQQRTGFSGEFKSKQIERQDRPAYALFALREGLVNAMVHRDYAALGGNVRVELFPDHLVIRNPGTLPASMTVADLKKPHSSHPRNPDIARAFYLRELMEQLGLGTQKLVAECKALNAKMPVWEADRDTVSLTLFRAPEPKVILQLSDPQRVFLHNMASGTVFKAADYAKTTAVSDRQARRELAEMDAFGLLQRVGKGPATAYRRTSRQPD
jgi:ATP-dependent DNA helicase RecG